MSELLWLCPLLMVALAVVLFILWGLTVWSAILIAILLVCPVIMVYGIIKAFRHPREISLEFPPPTRGMPLDWLAPYYDRYCPKIGLGRSFREETLRHAALRPGERVLDVGCGTGVLTRLAFRAVGSEGSVVGIDPFPKMIQVARKIAAAEGSRCEFKLVAIENLPFEEKTFDCVLSSLMIHHLPPDLKLQGFGELFRVLRPGGRLVVVDIAKPTNPLWWVFIWPLLFWDFTKDHVRGGLDHYFRQAGFSSVEILGHWMGLLTFYRVYKD